MIPAIDSSAEWYNQLTESSFLDYEIQKYLFLGVAQLIAWPHVWLLVPWVSSSREKSKRLPDIYLPWYIGSHSRISIHVVNSSIKILLITLKKEPAVTNWIASPPSCSLCSVETLAIVLEDYKHQIFNEIPQEYPLKNSRYNSRPRTVKETPQQIFPHPSEESRHEHLLLVWDLCPGFVFKHSCALLVKWGFAEMCRACPCGQVGQDTRAAYPPWRCNRSTL